MRVGVVSDTHGQVLHTQRAIRMLESLDVELVLHCGDIGSVEIVPLFSPWKTHFVLGNVDRAIQKELQAEIARLGQTYHGDFADLELAGCRIALLHGHDTRRFHETISANQWDLVCSGHTHLATQQQRGKSLLLNPGAVFRANPHSIAFVELPQCQATIVEI